MKLLVAVDLRDLPGPVVVKATEWASRLSATLDIVYVDQVNISRGFGDTRVRDLMDKEYSRMREKDFELLTALMHTVPEDLQGVVHILDGPAAETLVEHARTYDALLVATSGRTGLSHFWLGSVAERVIRSSTVPTIVMKAATSPA